MAPNPFQRNTRVIVTTHDVPDIKVGTRGVITFIYLEEFPTRYAVRTDSDTTFTTTENNLDLEQPIRDTTEDQNQDEQSGCDPTV